MECQLTIALPSANNGAPARYCYTYRVNNQSVRTTRQDAILLDRGANGSVIGPSCRIGLRTNRYIDLIGLRHHTVRELNIVEGLSVLQTQQGPIIGHFHQGALMSDGRTILSAVQLEAYGCTINNKSPKVNDNAQPHIRTPEGYIIPLAIENGLPVLQMRPPTDLEIDTLPHVPLTSENEWNPDIYGTPLFPPIKPHLLDPPLMLPSMTIPLIAMDATSLPPPPPVVTPRMWNWKWSPVISTLAPKHRSILPPLSLTNSLTLSLSTTLAMPFIIGILLVMARIVNGEIGVGRVLTPPPNDILLTFEDSLM